VSTRREGGALIWAGLACIVPVTLFHLFSQGAVVITPLSLIGAVVLTLGLVDRKRSSPEEPVLPSPGEVDRTESPEPLPPPPSTRD
jgi:hypothetical protein